MANPEITTDELIAALANMAEANPWLRTEFSDQPSFRERHRGLIRIIKVLGFGIIAFTALWGFKVASIDADTGLLHFSQIIP